MAWGKGRRTIRRTGPRATWICWSMTSETSTRQGSRVRRHGRSRPFSSNQGIRAPRTASALAASSSKPLVRVASSPTSVRVRAPPRPDKTGSGKTWLGEPLGWDNSRSAGGDLVSEDRPRLVVFPRISGNTGREPIFEGLSDTATRSSSAPTPSTAASWPWGTAPRTPTRPAGPGPKKDVTDLPSRPARVPPRVPDVSARSASTRP